MAAGDGKGPEATLERSLSRMRAALAAATDAGALSASPAPRLPTGATLGAGLLALAGGSVGLLVATGAWPFVALAVAFGVSGGLFLAHRLRPRRLGRSGGPAHIGMGASVSSSALVEPGAVVEMGATVKSGAIIRAGALVGMGATVGADAVVERGAVVSWGGTVRAGATVGANAVVGWGATVGANAVVEREAVVSWGGTVRAGATLGANSVVGWGATVGKGVQVPPGMRLRAGATVSAGWLREHWPGAPVPRPLPSTADPAEARAIAACDRLMSELRSAPEQVRNFLGTSEGTIAALRRTCEELLRREQGLRSEVDPSVLARLDEEKKQVEARLASATDESLRRSLRGAVVAIDEQRRQRDLLRLSADRLQAERMRLVYTLEGLVSQFVRLRTAGAEAGRAPAAGLEQGVRELGTELDAIAEALEQESQDVPPPTPRVRE